MNKFILRENNRDQFMAFISSMDVSEPVAFAWKPYKSSRSLDQNALYWQWLTVMAQHFTTPKTRLTKDDMHDLMRHKFLGYEQKVIGRTELPPQLKSTASCDVGEMHHYLTQIDMWAASMGCLLPRPEDSVYDLMCKEAA